MGISVSGLWPCVMFALVLAVPYAVCSWLWENS